MRDLKSKSKYLSLLLRHDPESAGISMSTEGWVFVNDLILKAGFTLNELETIVETDDKRRYSFDHGGKRIRANQGHSIKYVNIDFSEIIPPEFLYHGTVQTYINVILSDGLKKQTRNYLHLSKDVETATNVANRRGKPIILKIRAKDMYDDGYKFYISENGVYLSQYVPTLYISIC